jgi:hypothetical protein
LRIFQGVNLGVIVAFGVRIHNTNE